MKLKGCREMSHIVRVSEELLNSIPKVQVSDTTKADSSNAADNIIQISIKLGC